VPLSDGAGEVAVLGEGITRVKPGDRIIGTFHPCSFGGPLSADYLTDRLGANPRRDTGGIRRVERRSGRACDEPLLSSSQPATLPCAAVTAWVALTNHRRVTAGDTVLTQGSGGVSVLRWNLPGSWALRVIATTSTAEKAERLKALGGSEVINYFETPDWDEKAREFTDGRGVDRTVSSGHPGACDATHAATVKPGTADCSHRRARRAICARLGRLTWTKPSSRST
jgi:NADPH:quinone reductase-like Zn-dependent oxidoreductase